MRTVSFQGSQLTAGDRRRLAERQQVAASTFLNPVLQNQLQVAIDRLEERKEQGVKPEKFWFVERNESGTPFLGQPFGY